MSTENKALIGRKPECGHVVACDLDLSPRSRREYAKSGYDIQTLPTDEAIKLLQADYEPHRSICMKAKS